MGSSGRRGRPVFISHGANVADAGTRILRSALRDRVRIPFFFSPGDWCFVLTMRDLPRVGGFCSGRYTIACMFCAVPFFLPIAFF